MVVSLSVLTKPSGGSLLCRTVNPTDKASLLFILTCRLVAFSAKVFDDPEYKAAVIKAKGIWEYINYGDMNDTAKYLKGIEEVGSKFKPLLTGKPA